MKCPHCQREIDEADTTRRVLVVHANDAMAGLIARIVSDSGATVERAKSGREAQWLLQRGRYGLALVDVAISEPFAFELVPELKKHAQMRVVLIASVYDKAAYKRRPTSLYGADEYLEQHHLPDKLPVVLSKLSASEPPPELAADELKVRREELRVAAAELPTSTPDKLPGLVRELARKLVLDVSLYHADEFAAGVQAGDLSQRLAAQIAEAKRFLAERLPAPLGADDAAAFIDAAIGEVGGRR